MDSADDASVNGPPTMCRLSGTIACVSASRGPVDGRCGPLFLAVFVLKKRWKAVVVGVQERPVSAGKCGAGDDDGWQK